MHAQRIYCGISWRNPLVLKITDPQPAFLPMGVQTVQEVQRDKGGAVLAACVETLGSFEEAELWFEWRVYPGFALSSYEEGWQRLSVGLLKRDVMRRRFPGFPRGLPTSTGQPWAMSRMS